MERANVDKTKRLTFADTGLKEINTLKTEINETMHNNTSIVPYVSLCSGYEGIGLGLHRYIPNLRCIAYCEREAFAIANLVAKMENGLLDAAPVFTDVTTFPWEQYAPYMAGGILSFGWPCQPVSCAGKRKATEDERWLFDIIADGISIMRPGLIFAENVEGLLSAKMPNGSLVFAHCVDRLESLHYKVAAGIFSASECGAPHQRKRVFILAHCKSAGLERYDGLLTGCGESRRDTSEQKGQAGWSNSSRDVWPSRPGQPQHAWEPPRVVVNASLLNGAGQTGGQREAQVGRAGAEWDNGQAEPTLGGDADGVASRLDYAELCVTCDNRTDELRLLGNGVVPATAALAFTTLLNEQRNTRHLFGDAS
jgi:DNA (cytosine-5)-methyltransferase 1